ncbi:tyrosine-type recombinase/integrase [Aridibaculum aurantiacum]|uniref:tyrosine-type recombinase/integrase n=1 Tax=Aridibaculum aurantiacum TaxID=2810307 RepID=UPI001F61A340|nr:tyrosine-type recombinase/integrase [Aridibaculum aurantiacum]
MLTVFFMSIPEYDQLQKFLEYLQFEKRYSQHTILSYKTDLYQLIDYLQYTYEGVPLQAVTATQVRSWLASMRNDKATAKTINRKISSLKSFFKFLMRSGELEKSPMATIVAPKINKRLPSFVAETEMATLQTHVEFPDDWKGITSKLIISLLYATGIRLNELITLKTQHVDLYNQQVKVLGKGNKERIIPVGKDVLDQVKAYLKLKKEQNLVNERDHLLVTEKGKSLYPKFVYLVVKEHLGYVTTLNKKSPHVLRHTFATHLTNNGADLIAVKELLGHSSLAATQVYTHNTIDKLKNIHKQAHPKA